MGQEQAGQDYTGQQQTGQQQTGQEQRDDLGLLRAYEPVLRFTAGELFLPMPVEAYLGWCSLWHQPRGGRRREQIAAPGELDLDRLAELGLAHTGEDLSLKLVEKPLGRRELLSWRRNPARPRFRHSARFAAVGILGRFIDALMRLSLLFRGKVPGGTAASAARRYLESEWTTTHPYYGRVTRDAGYLVLQYWFFYAMNDWRSTFTGVNDHEADWEQVTLFLPLDADGSERPSWVAFSSHDEVGPDLRRRSDDPDITWEGVHPVVFAGAGSHSGAYLPGEYLVTVQPTLLRRVNTVVGAIRSTLFPWTERAQSSLGVPFVDYRRGDGVRIGPGTDRDWSPVLLDDRTPWVRHYRGLWGLDTSDPFGGERAPAGPRYERSGVRRGSWADPVAWAALDAVPPTAADEQRLLAERLPELEVEITAGLAELDETRERLRRAEAGTRALRRTTGLDPTVPAALEAELVERRTRLTRLEQERSAVRDAVDRGLPPDDVHAHLGHRAVPDIDPLRSPSALAHAWSLVSISVLLLGMAAVVLSHSTLVWLVAIGALIIGALLLESLARRRIGRFLLNTIVPFVILGAAAVLVVAFVLNWRYGVAGILSVAAVTLLVANLRDFFSKR